MRRKDESLSLSLKDYSDKKLAAKKQFGDRLFAEGDAYLKRNTKLDARKAYDLFNELKGIRPHDGLLQKMMDDAVFKGTDFVFVTLNNRSGPDHASSLRAGIT